VEHHAEGDVTGAEAVGMRCEVSGRAVQRRVVEQRYHPTDTGVIRLDQQHSIQVFGLLRGQVPETAVEHRAQVAVILIQKVQSAVDLRQAVQLKLRLEPAIREAGRRELHDAHSSGRGRRFLHATALDDDLARQRAEDALRQVDSLLGAPLAVHLADRLIEGDGRRLRADPQAIPGAPQPGVGIIAEIASHQHWQVRIGLIAAEHERVATPPLRTGDPRADPAGPCKASALRVDPVLIGRPVAGIGQVAEEAHAPVEENVTPRLLAIAAARQHPAPDGGEVRVRALALPVGCGSHYVLPARQGRRFRGPPPSGERAEEQC
jgi:hypothetical protein